MKKEYLYWTDKQWEALKKMTSSSMFKGTTWWACDLSIGRVKLNRVLEHYELEYPTHIVTLKKHVPPNGTDLHYLRYMYNEWSSYIKGRD